MKLLLRRLGHHLGRTIRLVPAVLHPTMPCGILLCTAKVDYICYAANTTPLHRQHIILHELGHLVFGHAGHQSRLTEYQPAPDYSHAGATQDHVPSWVDQLMPHLDPSGIRRLLNRSSYHAEDECEAEMFATLAGDRISRLVDNRLGSVPRDMQVVRLRALFDIPTPRGGNRG